MCSWENRTSMQFRDLARWSPPPSGQQADEDHGDQ
jgi:hypothetical protein